MNSLILVPLCSVSWALTIIKLRAIFRKTDEQKEKRAAALNLWAMLLFFSITLTLMDEKFATFLNKHTLSNLSLLVTHFAFLASQYFAVITILDTIGASANARTIFWIRISLGGAFVLLLTIYAFFVSKMPGPVSESPENLPVAIFKLLSYPFGIFLCAMIVKTVQAHLPLKEFALMRLRTITVIWCTALSGVYIFIRMLIYLGFFWPVFLSPWLFGLSHILLFCSVILFFAALMGNKIYTRFVLLSKSIEAWHAFCDLKYLADYMLLFCQVIGMPPSNPGFLIFLFNPEYYLYRVVISILDSKVTLAGMLTKATVVWSDEMLIEAFRIDTALQSANPSNDFADIVETYRRISRDLFTHEKETLTQAS